MAPMFPQLIHRPLSLPPERAHRTAGGIVLGLLLAFAHAATISGCHAPEIRESFPLGPEMALLERDAASPRYAEELKAFHPNDLHAELSRVRCRDSSNNFPPPPAGEAERAAWQAALERRKAIEAKFLAVVRAEYARRALKEEVEEGAEVMNAVLPTQGHADPTLHIEAILPAPGAEKEWPRWRGPTGQGTTTETGLPLRWSPTEHVAWKVEIPGRGNSSPVIWGDRIFLTTAFDKGKRRSLVGVRRSDGALLFVRDAPEAAPEPDVRDKNGYASATPVVDGERVVAFLGSVGLVAFDLDGNLVWRRELPAIHATHGVAASPVICGDLAILLQEQSENPSFGVAVDRRTGELRWKVERPAAMGWCTPLALRIEGRDRLVWGSTTAVVGLDPATGSEIWRCSGPTIEVVPTLAFGQGLVYSASGRSGPTIAIRPTGEGDVTSTNIAWRVVRNAPHVPSPLISGDILYQVSDTGVLTAFEAKTGATIYQTRLGARFSSSPIAGDGKVYLTSEEGDTFVVRDGRTYELLARNSIGEPVLASFAVRSGRIYIRSQRSLFAIEGGP